MKITNVSFVIVAHNEEFGLKKCLDSIAGFDLDNCEVICVDSGSTDGTLKVAKQFIGVIDSYTIVKITGHQNAAIARNAGLEHATKGIVFFVDGDVELKSEFISAAQTRITSGSADAVVGILEEYQYSDSYFEVIKVLDNRTSLFKEEKRYLCGGIFMVKRSVVEAVGHFDPKFKKSQDYDFTLRMTKDFKLLAIPVSMGIHHTIPYSNADRLRAELVNWLPVYCGMVIRKNISNLKGCLSYFHKIGYSKSIVIYLILLMSVISLNFLYLAFCLICLDIVFGIKKKQNIKHRLLSHYIFPFYMFYGFVFDLKTTVVDRTKSEVIQ